MRVLVLIIALLFNFSMSAQPTLENVLSGTFNAAVAIPGGSSDFQATGFFNDLTGRWADTDVTTGMIFWDANGERFEIMSISGAGVLTLDLRDIGSVGSISTGFGAIMVETGDYPVYVQGISGELQSIINNHFVQILDASVTTSNFKEERFTGVVGTNITITVGTPTADPADLTFYRNGLQQEPGVDFTIIGTNITLIIPATNPERFTVKFREE